MSIEVREIDGRQWKYCTCCHQYKGRVKCKHCGKPYRTPKALQAHERICYENPERYCPTCENTGIVRYYDDLHSQYTEEDCPTCVTAKNVRDFRKEMGL